VPELPEVETVRRSLEERILGRTIAWVRLSGKKLRTSVPATLGRRVRGLRFVRIRRHGKYLLLDLTREVTLLSHLGMSGRWLFDPDERAGRLPHVHVRIGFEDGCVLCYQDPRRFGLLRLVRTAAARGDPSLGILGPDPIETPPTGDALIELGRAARVSVKSFLLDQKRLAGIGNIYASEILHRAGVDPRRKAATLAGTEWRAVAAEISAVLREAIEGMGTTLSDYRTPGNETGAYGELLRVYDRAGEACLRCGEPIRRIVQAQRSTYYCPNCQRRDSNRRKSRAEHQIRSAARGSIRPRSGRKNTRAGRRQPTN
jgi:formamidopyrimidine-DNA glycosylase